MIAALLLASDAALLLQSPTVGLPDNGDFWRVMKPAGIRYQGNTVPSQKFIQTEFRLVEPRPRHLSSPAVVAWVARGIPAGNAKPGFMDLRQVGTANWLLLTGAVALLISASPARASLAVLLLWALGDPAYLLHFNSFFADAAAFIGTFGVAMWLLRRDPWAGAAASRTVTGAAVVLFAALAAFAKESYAPLGLVTAAAVVVAGLRSGFRNRAAQVTAVATVAIGVLAPLHFTYGSGYESPRDNRYNSVFLGSAVAAKDPSATLSALGLDPNHVHLKGKSLFVVDAREAAVAAHVSFLKIASSYLTDPHALGVAMRSVAEVISWPYATTVSNYAAPQQSGRRWVPAAFWHFGHLRRCLVRKPWHVWLWLSICIAWFCRSLVRREVDESTVVLGYLLGVFTTQVPVAVIGDGLRTLNRHLLTARLAFDWCLLIVVFSFARWIVSSIARRRAHHGRARSLSKIGASLVLIGLFGCNSRGSDPKQRARDPSATHAAGASAVPATAESAAPRGPSQIRTVFVVVLENKVWSEVKGNPDAPYLNGTLIPRASIAEGYRAPRDGAQHPSEPNYVWLEAGDNLGIGDDREPADNHRDTTDHLVSRLDRAGISWRSYQEDIVGDECPLTRHGAYAPKHDPMVFFDDVTDKNDPHSAKCIAHVRPLGELESDLASGKVARYDFITPNLCNDMHTACDPLRNVVKQGDLWLATWMPKILESSAWRENGVVFVTWDEAETHEPDCLSADCPIGLLALSPLAKGGGFTTKRTYDHGSLLRSLQEIFGVYPFIRSAARATDLSELFTSFP